jgi:hypothetical protein
MYRRTTAKHTCNSNPSSVLKAPNSSMRSNASTSNRWTSTLSRPVDRPLRPCVIRILKWLNSVVNKSNVTLNPNALLLCQGRTRSTSSQLITITSCACTFRRSTHATSSNLSSSSRPYMSHSSTSSTPEILLSNTSATSCRAWIRLPNNSPTLIVSVRSVRSGARCSQLTRRTHSFLSFGTMPQSVVKKRKNH